MSPHRKQRPRPRHPPAGNQGSPVEAGPPRPGEWLWTTREGAERDLVDELRLEGDATGRVVAPALVASARAPLHAGRVELTFARQGFRVQAVHSGTDAEELARALEETFSPVLAKASGYALHVWVPDSVRANPLSAAARTLGECLGARLAQAFPRATRVQGHEVGPEALPLLQVCLLAEWKAAAGVVSSSQALSLANGGRLRAHVPGDRPSRAARKLAEALLWLGVSPEPGELCVDLGAAPGGWTWLLLEKRARVIAVDPAELRPDLHRRRGLVHEKRSAFDFVPDEPVDWLFCDMAWRPREVAQMLAKWGRRRLAPLLVANFKLPMKRKAEMVRDVRKILEEGGYRGIRTRQLYHDRDEITLTARLV